MKSSQFFFLCTRSCLSFLIFISKRSWSLLLADTFQAIVICICSLFKYHLLRIKRQFEAVLVQPWFKIHVCLLKTSNGKSEFWKEAFYKCLHTHQLKAWYSVEWTWIVGNVIKRKINICRQLLKPWTFTVDVRIS